MKSQHALEVLKYWDEQGQYIFTKNDLRKIFPEDTDKSFSEGLMRLVKIGILTRVCHGIYLNPNANSLDAFTIERIAIALRRGEYNYMSLESLLSEYGLISQVPIDRLTIMTTGRKGVYKTPYGVIEFTHTKRSVEDILTHTKKTTERPLRIATQETALRDLKRVGRNINLVNKDE